MVLGLHWLSVVMHEWARNPLKCIGSGASGEGIHLLFPVASILLPVHFWATRNSPMRALSNVALAKGKHALSICSR